MATRKQHMQTRSTEPAKNRSRAKDRAVEAKATAHVDTVAHRSSPDERRAMGKALRSKLSRDAHGSWKAHAGRKDPIQLLKAADAGRLPELVPIRYGRMLQSPFAFYRGTAGLMAADLAKSPDTGLRVQACGDCHLMNFGGFATPERNVIFDINDFDETLPAPWEWDIKRLATSFVLAARSAGLPDAKGREMAEACARSYRRHIGRFAEMHPLELWYSRVTASDMLDLLSPSDQKRAKARIDAALKRTGSEMDFPKLAGVVHGRLAIRDMPPLIYHPEEARTPDFLESLSRVFASYRETLPDDRRVLLDRYQLVDAAIKVVGVGSVGRRCWIVLMMSDSNEPMFLQFKEAVASVLEPYAGASLFKHHGQRVVAGQRLMQPTSDLFLGWVTGLKGQHFYVRQLRDAKIKPLVETMNAALLLTYAKACGWVLARAHAKASDVCEIAGYLGTSSQFDEAMGSFGLAYADQAEKDHAALKTAVRQGRITAFQET
jgi:uncharacterized protein (DUF2252 family)